MKNFKCILLFFLLAIPFLDFSQKKKNGEEEEAEAFCVEVTNKKAIEYYEKSKDTKKYDKKEERVELLNKALTLEPDFVEAQFRLAKEMLPTWKLSKMKFGPLETIYRNIIRLCPQYHSDPYYYIGYNYYAEGRDDSATKFLTSYINFKDNDDRKFAKDYEQMIFNAKMMISQLKKDQMKAAKNVPFKPEIVLPISTKVDEFLCTVSPDDSVFLFTRRQPYKSMDQIHDVDEWKEVFMIAVRKPDGNFDEPEAMPYPFNKNLREGGPTLTINRKRLYYTAVANDGAGDNADIYFSDFTEDGWSVPVKVDNINDPLWWDSQPSISADGNTLFFASDREGGFGKTDIWMAFRDPKTGKFGKPVNCGPGINTPGREKCPFIHSDSETLYYCSDGNPDGYGGLDIYLVRKDEPGNWMQPVNIGSPINTEEDDAGFFVSTDGQWGYFAAEPSNKVRGLGVGKFDIYRFELYKEARPQEMTMLKGNVKNGDGATIKGADVEIKNPITKQIIKAVVDSSTGEWVAAVNKKQFKDTVIVKVNVEGHAFSATSVPVKNADFKNQPKPIEMEVKEMKVNERVVINEIHYKTNSAELESASFIMLNEFAQWLKENPKVKVEIGGHTDNVGSPASNLALSSDRAFTVKAYLEDRGIDGHRISAKGYGDTIKIGDNSTAEGRAANRRTEFKITAK